MAGYLIELVGLVGAPLPEYWDAANSAFCTDKAKATTFDDEVQAQVSFVTAYGRTLNEFANEVKKLGHGNCDIKVVSKDVKPSVDFVSATVDVISYHY